MPNTRYYRLLAATWTICLAVACTAQAASLRFILFCDTMDPSIGTIQDLNRSTTWAQTIASNTALALHLQTLTGNYLTPAGARAMLNSLRPEDADVIYFVFSGHGANPGDSAWPMFTFLSESTDPPLTFDEVVSILQPKPHRMLVVISDCCNVAIDGTGRAVPDMEPRAPSATTIANFKRLFLDFQGTIVATAASEGQYSLGDTTSGGIFLDTFVKDFNELAGSTQNLSWEAVLARVAADTNKEAKSCISSEGLGDMQPQLPHYVIGAGQSGPDVPADPATPTTPSTRICGAMGTIPPLMTLAGYLLLMAGRRTYLPRR